MENDVCLTKEAEPPSQELEPPSEELEPPSCSAVIEGSTLSGLFFQQPPSQPSLFELPKSAEAVPAQRARGPASFKTSPRSRMFRMRFFPKATNDEWNDWRWQLRNRIKDVGSLSRVLRLSDDEREAVMSRKGPLPVCITPYYASLLSEADPAQPIRRTVVPAAGEYTTSPGEAEDPLGEDAHSPVPGIVHRYPDRVLFLVTGFCSTNCRYCTRSRMVGDTRRYSFNLGQWEKAVDYIGSNPKVRDVLLSGGDPLTLPDEKIEWLLQKLRRIPHVEMLRIGTKAPAVLPQRVTPALSKMLRRYHPLFISLHFTHPDELTPEAGQACSRLADAGIPLGSQTVLLKGVNDDIATMTRLVQGLVKFRVRPYYLYQCDPIPGSSHFRTPVGKGIEVIRGLRGHTSGYCVPTYVIDAPGGGGKVPLLPEYVSGREGDDLLLNNYEGGAYRYPDPGGIVGQASRGAP